MYKNSYLENLKEQLRRMKSRRAALLAEMQEIERTIAFEEKVGKFITKNDQKTTKTRA